MAELIATDCPDCGGRVSAFARWCPHCGLPNRARWAAFAVAGAFAALLLAIGVALFIVLRWERLPFGAEQAEAQYTWLATAMAQCEDEASKRLDTLQFLVVPLAPDDKDIAPWKAKSLNDIGNAILLTTESALDALRNRMLRISTEEYVFGIRDQAGAIYRWNPSTGVKKFSTDDAGAIENFNLQFLTRSAARESAWGAKFGRIKGNCYWVNAIIGN
jgi:hypothetical protein